MVSVTLSAVLFDMDGLLYDSEQQYQRAYDDAAVEFGYRIPMDLYRGMVGKDAAQRKLVLQEHYGKDFPFDEIFKRRIALGEEREARDGVPLKPGAEELLRALASRAIPRALATASRRPMTERRLQKSGIFDLFGAIVTLEDVPKMKPAPDPYLRAAELLNVPAAGCVVLEDSDVGARAALAAGMRFIIVPDLQEPAREIACQALAVVPSLHDALALLVR